MRKFEQVITIDFKISCEFVVFGHKINGLYRKFSDVKTNFSVPKIKFLDRIKILMFILNLAKTSFDVKIYQQINNQRIPK